MTTTPATLTEPITSEPPLPASVAALEADYAARNPRSRRQYELGRTVMPGGVAKGAYFNKPYPLFLVSGEGCYVTTLDGQRLLDCANHHTAGVLGHRHPAVMEAVREQLAQGVALGGPTTVEYELARELTQRVPSLERVRFTGSGGEAAQNVLRLVRGWTGRPKIAKFEGAFHGRVGRAGNQRQPAARPGRHPSRAAGGAAGAGVCARRG